MSLASYSRPHIVGDIPPVSPMAPLLREWVGDRGQQSTSRWGDAQSAARPPSRAASERRLLVVKAEAQIKAKCFRRSRSGPSSLREGAEPGRPEGTARAAGADEPRDPEARRLPRLRRRDGRIKRAIDDRKTKLEHVDGQLKAAEVLHDFDILIVRKTVADVGGLAGTTRPHPAVFGQVPGQAGDSEDELVPQHDGKAGSSTARPTTRAPCGGPTRTSSKRWRPCSANCRIKSAGAGRASLPTLFDADGLPHDGQQPLPRFRASISAKAPWRTCWRRSGSRR